MSATGDLQSQSNADPFWKIEFSAGNGSPTRASRSRMDRLATFLHRREPLLVELTGHGRDSESLDECMALAFQRAEQVASYLVQHGVPRLRLIKRALADRVEGGESKAAGGHVDVRFVLLPD